MCCIVLYVCSSLGLVYQEKKKFVNGRSVFECRKIYAFPTPSSATSEEVRRSGKGIQERGRSQLSKSRKDDQEEEGL